MIDSTNLLDFCTCMLISRVTGSASNFLYIKIYMQQPTTLCLNPINGLENSVLFFNPLAATNFIYILKDRIFNPLAANNFIYILINLPLILLPSLPLSVGMYVYELNHKAAPFFSSSSSFSVVEHIYIFSAPKNSVANHALVYVSCSIPAALFCVG